MTAAVEKPVSAFGASLFAGIATTRMFDTNGARSAKLSSEVSLPASQVSVQFATGTPPDGGSAYVPVSPVFHIDSVTDGSGGAPGPANLVFHIDSIIAQ
jgi:hypothetical protein